VSHTVQTWVTVAATLGAAFLGAIVAYLGAARQQRRQSEQDARIRQEQARHDARMRLEQGIAELLAAAQDVMVSVQALRQAHALRTTARYYLRIAAMIWRDYPAPANWSDLKDLSRLRPLLGTALEAERYQLDESRMIALDAATILAPKLNRYFAVVALLTLGQDRSIADAVRELTPKVVSITQSFGHRKGKAHLQISELQTAMERFREAADKHLSNVADDQERR
jgi:hypothetical protein